MPFRVVWCPGFLWRTRARSPPPFPVPGVCSAAAVCMTTSQVSTEVCRVLHTHNIHVSQVVPTSTGAVVALNHAEVCLDLLQELNTCFGCLEGSHPTTLMVHSGHLMIRVGPGWTPGGWARSLVPQWNPRVACARLAVCMGVATLLTKALVRLAPLVHPGVGWLATPGVLGVVARLGLATAKSVAEWL